MSKRSRLLVNLCPPADISPESPAPNFKSPPQWFCDIFESDADFESDGQNDGVLPGLSSPEGGGVRKKFKKHSGKLSSGSTGSVLSSSEDDNGSEMKSKQNVRRKTNTQHAKSLRDSSGSVGLSEITHPNSSALATKAVSERHFKNDEKSDSASDFRRDKVLPPHDTASDAVSQDVTVATANIKENATANIKEKEGKADCLPCLQSVPKKIVEYSSFSSSDVDIDNSLSDKAKSIESHSKRTNFLSESTDTGSESLSVEESERLEYVRKAFIESTAGMNQSTESSEISASDDDDDTTALELLRLPRAARRRLHFGSREKTSSSDSDSTDTGTLLKGVYWKNSLPLPMPLLFS